ncbi:hypothetical protein ACFWPH_28355 [Nocardia sp. NPDC058499]|uniref:hypothetical protein n=1 Tax=Nocardia sp. NPDC058499 TaxID=3346530 RepID=UPI003658FBFE
MHEPDYSVYADVVAALTRTPATALVEVEAKAIAARWLSRTGYPPWRGGRPCTALRLWATTDAPRTPQILHEAQHLLDEITDPARTASWSSNADGPPETAATAVRALVGYLNRPPTTPPPAAVAARRPTARGRRTPQPPAPPVDCACGCGQTAAPGREYAPRHQQREVAAVAGHYFGGSVQRLLAYVEDMAEQHGVPDPATGALRRIGRRGPTTLVDLYMEGNLA